MRSHWALRGRPRHREKIPPGQRMRRAEGVHRSVLGAFSPTTRSSGGVTGRADGAAEHGFYNALHADHADDEHQRTGRAHVGDQALHIIAAVEKQHEQAHKEHRVEQAARPGRPRRSTGGGAAARYAGRRGKQARTASPWPAARRST